eukprot:CAMPEP_0179210070 /NCGR_PEP_ID=MMETSP0796-20121207/104773_1 /TAXON_ID=73915 /ORGANISM="Pyrodinium bahamense, Strain pbaha01" /LENGTH=224 /DNA_ID=CAMNT_0020915035 /DNA_START=68 /DNA_END=739 /DNA_ORIENTATION=+
MEIAHRGNHCDCAFGSRRLSSSLAVGNDTDKVQELLGGTMGTREAKPNCRGLHRHRGIALHEIRGVPLAFHTIRGIAPALRRTCGIAIAQAIAMLVQFKDPRSGGMRDIGIIGFFHPGRDEAVLLCRAGFLGNRFDVGHHGGCLELEAPCTPGSALFRHVDAALQALLFWAHAGELSQLSDSEAVRWVQQRAGQEDLTYGGFGSQWKAMLAVLRAKFNARTPLA